MRKLLPLTVFLFLFYALAQAQKTSGSVKGTLHDSTTATGPPDATVSVIRAADSSLISFTLTNSNGYFEIKNLDTSHYVLLVSYEGFQSLKKPFAITAQQPEAIFGIIPLPRTYKTLDEVVVADRAPVRVKGDTLAFNANAFKTNKPNATAEDLLKKLPGIQVDRDGTVKAQGEEVQKVYVDGKEFFGNDPKIATKNLSADMIDEVEVYDDMSEQAKFNKIEDGSRTKAINLKLKKDRKKGVFGQVSTGYGTDERYNANLRLNFFKGATRVGVFANANNTNRLGFSTTDMMGMGNMGGGMNVNGGFGGMGGWGNMGSGNGITSSWAAGINYNDTWSKYFEVNGNYNFNHTGTDYLRKSYRQNFFTASTIIDDQQSLSSNQSDVHRSGFRITYTLKDRNSIVYTPNISLQNSENYRQDSSTSFRQKGSALYKLNENRSRVLNTGSGTNWNNNLIWRKKFAKAGRTLALTFNNTYNRSQVDGYNNTLLTNYDAAGDRLKDSAFNQQNIRNSRGDNYGASLSYTEPVGRDKIWEVNYSYSNNQNASDRETYDLNSNNDKYEFLNDSLSNEFENRNTSNRAGTNLRIVKKKYNYQLGISVQQTLLQSHNLSKASLIKQKYTNIFPNASFTYQFARSRSLRFNYRGRTNQPSVKQLQPLVDVSNPRYLRTGNPLLNQEFINNFSLNYNFFNVTKFRNLFAGVNYSNTMNKIVNSTTVIDSFGTQLTLPVNINGVYNVNGNFNIGFPIKKLQGGNFNATTRVSFNRNANLVNGTKNFIRNLNLGEDLRLNYTYKEQLDLGVTASMDYTSATYSVQAQQNNDYYTHRYSVDATYTFNKGFIVASDLDYTANTGLSQGYNQNYFMWNASVAKQLFKDKRGEVRLSVFDLLDQNISLSRTVNENYIEDVQTNVLKRFFMLSFTYNINRMGGKNMPGAVRPPGRRIMVQ